MIKIEKDVAAFIRSKLPTACIKRTMSGESKRGNFYIEQTKIVERLLKEYYETCKIIEEYPYKKEN